MWFNRNKKAEIEKAVQSQLDEWYKLADFLGISRDVDGDAMAEATYFACMKILAEAIGKMPLRYLRHTERSGVEVVRNDALYTLIHDRPNPYQSAAIFWSTMELCRNHYGNAFAWIQGAGTAKDPYRLWLLPPDQVQILYDDAKKLADYEDIYYIYTAGGQSYPLSSEEVIHVKSSMTLDGIVGIPVRDQLKATIQGNAKAQELLNKLYDNGFTSKIVLNYTGSLNDKSVQTMIDKVQNYISQKVKTGGAEKVIPMPIGFSIQPLNTKLTDNQFLELKQFTSSQIAAAFGIKPCQYNDLSKSSYASGEQQNLAFYVDTLLYIIKQYEEELTYKLIPDSKIRKGYHIKFNVSAILRSDFEKQMNTLASGVARGIYTRNEARALLDLESLPGGDDLTENGNIIPLRMAGIQYTRNGKEETSDEHDNREGGQTSVDESDGSGSGENQPDDA